ncbi:MAG: M48 family metalloprotease [Pseudomonadota bacterium]
MNGSVLFPCPDGRSGGLFPHALLLLAFVAYVGGLALYPSPPVRQAWFPDIAATVAYRWQYAPCPGCEALEPAPVWLRMQALAGLDEVHFLLSPDEQWGPAYSFPPNAVVVSREALRLPACQLNFLVGHELVHLAQRHFDEDARAAAVLSGLAPGWTTSGKRALSLIEGDFGLALKMSPLWQQQEREADWVGVLLAAQASGCSLEAGALAYLEQQAGQGGGLAAAHEDSVERVRHLRGFTDIAAQLAVRGS